MRRRPKEKLRDGTTKRGALVVLYGSYRRKAKIRQLSFSLTLEEAERLFFGACHYCGVSPSQNCRGHLYNGIDRVDNKKGYVPENCVGACGFCNLAKRGNSVQQFYTWIERLTRHHGQRNVSTQSSLQEPVQVSEGEESPTETGPPKNSL